MNGGGFLFPMCKYKGVSKQCKRLPSTDKQRSVTLPMFSVMRFIIYSTDSRETD